MSNWHPKPLRPKDPNPLFQKDDSFVIKKSSSLTPLQRQRLQDGTQHTRGSQYRIKPTQATQIMSPGPRLYIGNEEVSKSVSEAPVPPNADEIVKSFLAKGTVEIEIEDDDEEDTEKAVSGGGAKAGGTGAKIGEAVGKVAGTAVKVAGKVAGTAVGLANRAN